MATSLQISSYKKANNCSRDEAKEALQKPVSQDSIELNMIKEIEKEFRNKSYKNVISAGYFYKDDEDDGVSFVLDRSDFPTDAMYEVLLKIIDRAAECIARMIEREAEDVEVTFNQLTAAIHNYNIKSFGSPVRSQICEVNTKIDQEMIELFVCIGSDIVALTKLGEIPQNNFNGTSVSSLKNGCIAIAV